MTRQPIRRRRGAAMTEMVLAVPFFLIVLSLMFYLGRGMVRAQHTQVLDRYEGWRATSGSPTLTPNEPFGHAEYNQAFFAGKAASVGIDSHPLRIANFDELFATRVENSEKMVAEKASELAHRFHEENMSYYVSKASSEHHLSAKLWSAMDTPIFHAHIRGGHDWSFATQWRLNGQDVWVSSGGGARQERAIRETYFVILDDVLDHVDGEEGLAHRIQGLYNSTPHYVGPTVKF